MKSSPGKQTSPDRTATSSHVERLGSGKNSALPLQFVPEGIPKRASVDVDPYLTFESQIPDNLAGLRDRAVQLERVLLKYPTVHCIIRVLDISFSKTLFVRVTTDDWRTYQDAEAKFIDSTEAGHGSCQFCAIIRVPREAQRIDFAICYRVDGKEYWDNCSKTNYRVRVILHPPNTPDSRRSSGVSSTAAAAAAAVSAGPGSTGTAAGSGLVGALKSLQISAV